MTFLDRGGILIVDDLLGNEWLNRLIEDSRERRLAAERFVTSEDALEEWRGGNPARAYWATSAGPIQHHVFGCSALLEALSGLIQMRVESAGSGSYTYYEAGDHLAIHRDILRCDLALITCLENEVPALNGGLRVYPESMHQPLSVVRADRSRGVDVPLAAGQTVILAGGIVPHEVTPCGEGQQRHVALACYTMVDASFAGPPISA